MKSKIRSGGCGNVYPIDGVLDDIPLPDDSVDYLFTSQAIGWNLEGELREIERILKPDGSAVHLLKDAGDEEIRGLHEVLTSSEWDYRCERFPDASGPRLKYVKRMHSKSE